MFPRLGMVLLARQIERAQRARAISRMQPEADARLVPYQDEFGMLLRLGAVVVIGMGLVALVMTTSM